MNDAFKMKIKPLKIDFEDSSSDYSRLLRNLASCNQDHGSPYNSDALKIFVGQGAAMAQRENANMIRCTEQIFMNALERKSVNFTTIELG